MDYFDDFFLDKESILVHTFSMEGQKALGLNLKHLKLCSEDGLELMGLERHEGEIAIKDIIFIFG